jgi:hypothetical protein
MTGESKPGEAKADKWREEFERNRKESDISLTRLEVRAEMRSVGDFEEDTGVIHKVAEQQVAKRDSEAPKSKGSVIGVLNVALGFKQWPQVVALAIIVGGLLVYLFLRK